MNTINDYSFITPVFKNWKQIWNKECHLSLTENSLIEKRILKKFNNFTDIKVDKTKNNNPVRDFLKNQGYMQWDTEYKEWVPLKKDLDDYYEEKPTRLEKKTK